MTQFAPDAEIFLCLQVIKVLKTAEFALSIKIELIQIVSDSYLRYFVIQLVLVCTVWDDCVSNDLFSIQNDSENLL